MITASMKIKSGLVDGIMGSKFLDLYEQDQCIVKSNELEKTVSAYYLLGNELFNQQFYKYFWKTDNQLEIAYGYE